jgi:hypothetical protein
LFCRAVDVAYLSGEHPVSPALCLEVLLLHLGGISVAVLYLCPLPHHPKNVPVYRDEGLLADYVAVVVGPTPDDGVQLHDKGTGRRLSGCGR